MLKRGLNIFMEWFKDNALKFIDPDVEIIFLPPNTTSLIQPLDQDVTATFKSYYVKKSFQYIFNLLELKILTFYIVCML